MSRATLLPLVLVVLPAALGQTQERRRPGDLGQTVAQLDTDVPPGTWATYVVRSVWSGGRGQSAAVASQAVVGGDAATITVERAEAGGPRRVTRARGDAAAFLVALVPGGERLNGPAAAALDRAVVAGREVACVRVTFEVARRGGGVTRCVAWLSDEVPGAGLVGLDARTTAPGLDEAAVWTLAGFGGPDEVRWGTRLPDLGLPWPTPATR